MFKTNWVAQIVTVNLCVGGAGLLGNSSLGCASSDSNSTVGSSQVARGGSIGTQTSPAGFAQAGAVGAKSASGVNAGGSGASSRAGNGSGGITPSGSQSELGGSGAPTHVASQPPNSSRANDGGRGNQGGSAASSGSNANGTTTTSMGGLNGGGAPASIVSSSIMGGAQSQPTSLASAGRTAMGGASPSAGAAARAGAPSTGGAPGSSIATSSCAIAAYDAANPPKALSLSGNLGTHDPVAMIADGTYYLYATGNGIGAKTSSNLTNWTGAPDVFSKIPSWVSGKITAGTVTNIWAPDVSYFGGQYHLYYAVSTFGHNQSCIGHATRANLSLGTWSDEGAVICSNVGTKDDWNAIDPNVILDDAGTPWMAFGSFWSGIKLVRLDMRGNRDGTDLRSIANSKAIEAPFIIRQCGYYYLFVSFGSCCGSPWDYNIRVGRSKSVEGPYVDKAGVMLTNGGGTLLVEGNTTWTAPGHNAIVITANGAYNLYHALDAKHENPVLRVSQLVMDADGWPVSGGP